MPTAIQGKAQKEKIVNYLADGTRETVGYRVEEWISKSKSTGPRAKYDPTPKIEISAETGPTWTYTSSAQGFARTKSTSKCRTSHTKPERAKELPPVVHTEKRVSKKSHELPQRAANLPSGWIHSETHERYDYHQGVRKPSYAVNSVTYVVDYVPATPVRLDGSALA